MVNSNLISYLKSINIPFTIVPKKYVVINRNLYNFDQFKHLENRIMFFDTIFIIQF